jgi:Xaa-Pro aminopeptidase
MAERGSPDWAGRLGGLQELVARERLDAIVISAPPNVTYLTGFVGSAGLLLAGGPVEALILDGRYEGAARELQSSGRLAPIGIRRVDVRYDRTLGEAVRAAGLRRVGFEAGHVTVANLGTWSRATPGVEWVPMERAVEQQRLVKDAAEIATFRRAGRAIGTVAGALSEIVARGRSEREIALSIDTALLNAGFERPAFQTIVASGPNSALPHARPTARRLVEGDLVVLDFGGVLDGYCVDLTRMAAVGPIPARAMVLHDAVRDANAAATLAVRPGVEASDVDRAARDVLEARELGDAFLHATGHGLGLEVHEAPRIAKPDADASDRLQAGMVFTIEPGAYVSGIGGARLEDDVLVTPEGCEVLTDVPHELLRV